MADLHDIFEGLNSEQRRAVETTDGTFRILAGPGTGKTETLSRRFAYLIATGRATEDEIALLTFSRRAAAEVRGRIEKRLGTSHGALRVTTFHSFGRALLRDNAALAGLSPGIDVLTPFKGWLVVRLAAERAELPTAFARVRGSPTLHAEAQRLVSILKQCGIAPTKFEDVVRGGDSSPELRTLASIYSTYERLLAELGSLDVDDLVGRAVQLLETAKPESIRLAPIRHLLVDEYQDTNPMQARLLGALARRVAKASDGRPNLCVIGDPDQSIYRFRGTTAENLIRFPETFSLSDGGDLRLDESYRSVPEVLAAAAVLNRLHRDGEAFVPSARRASGGPLAVQSVREDTAPNEAFFIVRRIVEWLADESASPRLRPRDVAVLFRSVHSSARGVEMALRGYGIPYRVAGATGFYRQPVVRLATAAIRWLVDVGAETALEQVLASEPMGLDPRSLRLCIRRARDAGLPAPLGWYRYQDSFATPSERRTLVTFLDEAEALRRRASSLRLVDAVYEVLRITRIFDWLVGADADGRASSRSVARFHEMAREYEEIERAAGRAHDESLLRRFAHDLDEASNRFADESEAEIEDDVDAVRLLTVHQAKGLEFRAVFVAGLSDGVFPMSIQSGPLLRPDELVPILRRLTSAPLPWAETREEHLAEERRLAYVAATRARDRLILTRAARTHVDLAESPFFTAVRDALPAEGRLENPYGRSDGIVDAREAPEILTSHEVEFWLRRVVTGAPNREELAQRLVTWNESLPRRRRLDLDYVTGARRYERANGCVVTLPDRLRVSATSLRDWLSCPRKFYYRHLLDVRTDETFNASLGSFVHEVLEAFHRRHPRLEMARRDVYAREIVEIAEERFVESREVFPSELEARAALAIARLVLPEYVDEECGRAEGRETVWIEERLAFDFGGQTVESKIDRVDRVGGGWEIIDYKTSATTVMEDGLRSQFLPKEGKSPSNFQLPLYWHALRKTKGIAADALVVCYIPARASGKREFKRPRLAIVERPGKKSLTPADLESAASAIQETIGEIRAGTFAPDPAEPSQCREQCDFYGICYRQG